MRGQRLVENSSLQLNRFEVTPFIFFQIWPGILHQPNPVQLQTNNNAFNNLHNNEAKQGHLEPAEFACQRLLQLFPCTLLPVHCFN